MAENPIDNNKEIKPEDEINIRSDDVQEIISHIPNWLVRSGIGLIFIIFTAVLIISWFIKYPDTIKARVTITTEPPPAKLVARVSGSIQFLIKNGDSIQKETVLAFIRSAAQVEDIIKLDKSLTDFSHLSLTEESLKNYLSTFDFVLQVGDIQSDYTLFIKNVNDLLLFYNLHFQEKQINQLRAQVNEYKSLNNRLTVQKKLLEKETKLIQKKFNIDSSLLAQKVISSLDLDNSEAIFLQKKREFENAEISVINNTIQMSTLQSRINEFELDKIRQEKQFVVLVENAFKTLQSNLKRWKEMYVFESPISGKVTFLKFWSNNQFVNSGEEVLSVIPRSNQLLGKIELPLIGSGKVKRGQRVTIRLDNYPYDQFGMLEGKVENISEVPNNNLYIIDISLPNRLTTSYNKELEFKQQMQGSTEIITEDLRLLQRVFYQFKSIWSKYGNNNTTPISKKN